MDASTPPAPLNYRVDIGNLLTRSWKLLTRHPLLIIGGTAVLLLISFALEFIPFLGPILGIILHGPLLGGAYVSFLKLIRNQPATFADIWGGFGPPFVNLMIAG